MVIRRATPQDCVAIHQVMQNSFSPFKHFYTTDSYANTVVGQDEILRRMQEGVTWVAEVDAQVLGTVSIAFQKDWLYVTGMAVDPRAQGKKMGYHLLKTIEEYALNNGHKQLYLGTTKFLNRAVSLYTRIGYSPQEKHEREWYGITTIWFEKILEDA